MTRRPEPRAPRREKAYRAAPAPRSGWIDRAIRRAVLFAVGVGLRLAVVAAAILGVATWAMYARLPEAAALLDGRDRGSVTLLDRRGEVFAWRGEQFGGAIRPATVSPHLVNAILAAEDRRFRRHWGVDPVGLARAIVVNARAGRLVQGGSTITQQVAKNVFLTDERSFDRKIKEIPMAFAMELKYDKDEILAIYLNRVYLGAGAYGFEAASQRYFGKSAREVGPAEAAMLAGLLKAPSRFAPTSDIAGAQARAGVVIAAMEREGYLTAAQAAEARAAPAALSRAAARRAGGHFADWVMEQGPAYLTEATTEDVTIATTFDPLAQRAAEEALAAVFEADVKEGSKAEAAIVVMSPDGAVRAMVGGRRGAEGSFNRATQAMRQTGSAFKTIVFAAAVERGARPDDVEIDAPLTIGRWSPENYGGGYAGRVTLREAFARSINTVAVRLSERYGRDAVRRVARKLGVSTSLAEGPALALGVSEATLLEMTGAYGAFASGGLSAAPWGIREIRVRGDRAPLMTGGEGPRRRALDARVAARMTAMLASVVTEGTGTRAALPDGRPVAGKTGTTQEARDAWFIGFSAQYVVGVWMGRDDNRPLAGVTGGGLPAAIWRETMARLHRDLPVEPLPAERSAPALARTRGDETVAEKDEGALRSILRQVVEAIGR